MITLGHHESPGTQHLNICTTIVFRYYSLSSGSAAVIKRTMVLTSNSIERYSIWEGKHNINSREGPDETQASHRKTNLANADTIL